MTDTEIGYIRDTRDQGDLVLWWKPKAAGYTRFLSHAGLYERLEFKDRNLSPDQAVFVPASSLVGATEIVVPARCLEERGS